MAGQPKRRARAAAAALLSEKPKSDGKAPKAGAEPGAPDVTARANGPAEPGYAEYQSGLSQTETIVEEIVTLMSTGRWVPGFSHKDLAKKYDRTPDRIVHLATEASRAVRRAVREGPDFAEECRAECLSTFRAIRAIAMAKATAKDATGVGTVLMAGLHATRLFGFYTGVEPARKTEDVTPQRDDFAGWTREEIEAFAVTGEEPARLLGGGDGLDTKLPAPDLH